MALFKSIDAMAGTIGTMFPGTIVPIRLASPAFCQLFWAAPPRDGVEELAILSCPGCGRGGLRVPDGRRGKVTCPSCGAQWFHPETVESSEVEFRCSKTGARFTAIASRRSPLHQFVLKETKNVTLTPTDDSTAATASLPKP